MNSSSIQFLQALVYYDGKIVDDSNAPWRQLAPNALPVVGADGKQIMIESLSKNPTAFSLSRGVLKELIDKSYVEEDLTQTTASKTVFRLTEDGRQAGQDAKK